MTEEERHKLILPLRWSFHKVRSQLTDTRGVWDGLGVFNYEIHRSKQGRWVWARSPARSNFHLPYTDLRTCKKACELDYKNRISAALI